MQHSELLGKSDEELKLLAPEATHQHFKGGLYRYHGEVRDADSGEHILGKDGYPRISYQHQFPHKSEPWLRDNTDFFGIVNSDGDPIPRFRELL